MSIDIIYPEKGPVEDSIIERWFVEAVRYSMIEPRHLKAKTVHHMAVALDAVGIIALDKSKPPFDKSTIVVIPRRNEDKNEAR